MAFTSINHVGSMTLNPLWQYAVQHLQYIHLVNSWNSSECSQESVHISNTCYNRNTGSLALKFKPFKESGTKSRYTVFWRMQASQCWYSLKLKPQKKSNKHDSQHTSAKGTVVFSYMWFRKWLIFVLVLWFCKYFINWINSSFRCCAIAMMNNTACYQEQYFPVLIS